MLTRVGFIAFAIVAGAVASAGAERVTASQFAMRQPRGAVPNVIPAFARRVVREVGHAPKPTATPPAVCRTYGADAGVRCEIVTCQYNDGDCVVYATTGKALATLTGLTNPQGVTSDRQNNSYIANAGASNILKYSRGLTKLEEIFQDPGQYPVDVDVDVPARLLAASNIGTTNSGPGSVSVYAGGASKPTATLTDPAVGAAQGIGIAIDKDGNCFWSLNDPQTSQGQIDEFKGCAGSPTKIVGGIAFAGGVAFDHAGALYYADQIAGAIERCVKGKCMVLTSGFSDPVFINFDDRWKFLWVADFGAAAVDAVDPATGLIVASFPAIGGAGDPPFGIAHAPGPLY